MKATSKPPQYQIGIQNKGTSSTPIYAACEKYLCSLSCLGPRFADVGGGRGDFTRRVRDLFDEACLIDFDPGNIASTESRSADLNSQWPARDDEFDVTCALEVIEHVENPRHFLRELLRVTKPNGHILITTPNQVSIASKLCFLIRSQHQHFQDSCYPAHITPMLPVDFQRIARELNQENFEIRFTNSGRIPGTRTRFQTVLPFAKGRLFSDNLLFSLRVEK